MSGYHCFSLKAVTARKRHRCIYCGQHIETGDQYQRENSISDGSYQNFAWHPECLAEQREYARQGDSEFMAHSADRPPKLEPQPAPTAHNERTYGMVTTTGRRADGGREMGA